MPSVSSLYAVGGSQIIKHIKSVTSLILKKRQKRKVTTIVCVFLRKARTKNTKSRPCSLLTVKVYAFLMITICMIFTLHPDLLNQQCPTFAMFLVSAFWKCKCARLLQWQVFFVSCQSHAELSAFTIFTRRADNV